MNEQTQPINSVHYLVEMIANNSSHFVRVRKAKFFEALNSAEGDLSTREFIKDGVKSIILHASA
tara:strand:+ start:339 stop:530 length:192 start_codon:yes stop_codon:yes gene_type:complete